MPRRQLSLNVSGLDAAVDFCRRLFGVKPAKLKPGYANFAIDSPPLKLVLNSPGNGPGTTINHPGVEVETPEQVEQAGSGWNRRPEPGARGRGSLLLRAAGQSLGPRPRWRGLGVLHDPGRP
jgi:catechol 2,3-dioxygenase-like lactoylglutathione lyase family enzyme